MKTEIQIADYIRKAGWFDDYLAALKAKYKPAIVGDFTSGRYNLATIIGAFNWSKTPQGHDYWQAIQNQFIDWYGNV